jgi:hypothetical protein
MAEENCVLGEKCQSQRIARSKGSTRLSVSLPEDGNRPRFQKVLFFLI